jgi:hypothetical protein
VTDVGTGVKKTLEAVEELVKTLKEKPTAEAKAVTKTKKGRRCKATLKNGNPCKRFVARGEPFCAHHTPPASETGEPKTKNRRTDRAKGSEKKKTRTDNTR